ncbi:MAG TPA: response regulator transcription factor [candidate division Zixibacteria bacterium]|nr:response regulator transcription factor [candidate division Zixibacteria bacterium]
MAHGNILIVEDEEDILALVTYNLTREGYAIRGLTSGDEALAAIAEQTPDLLILDLMLPGLDGLELCRRIKANSETAHIPIIMLTARGEEADIVTGLELGADDYITKPFSQRILSARVKACLRRPRQAVQPEPSGSVRIHSISLDPGRFEAQVDGQRVELTLTEFRILQLLARKPGWVFTRYQIVDAVHGEDHPVTDRSVDVQIVSLRRKLGAAGAYIETVRGIGYRMREPGA